MSCMISCLGGVSCVTTECCDKFLVLYVSVKEDKRDHTTSLVNLHAFIHQDDHLLVLGIACFHSALLRIFQDSQGSIPRDEF